MTVGLEPGLAALRLLGQVHNSRSASFLRHYTRTSVRNLNRRAVPCRGPRLFRLTRSIRFSLRETAHWADARLVSRALRLLGQVRNSRGASILRPCSFAHHASASLHPALRALGSAPHRCIRQTSQVAWEKNTVRICGGKSENWKRQALKKSSQNVNTETEKKRN